MHSNVGARASCLTESRNGFMSIDESGEHELDESGRGLPVMDPTDRMHPKPSGDASMNYLWWHRVFKR